MAMTFPPVQTNYVQATGGLNLVQPTIANDPGFIVDGYNFEVSPYGGYRRIKGYERFDGRTSPSSVSYAVLEITLTGSGAVGDTITGVTSGATGVICALTGSAFVITKTSLDFTVGETINITGAPVATVVAAGVTQGATSAYFNAVYIAAAADIYRADIQAVPGSGSVRGVWVYNGIKYAFRDNVGATAGAMFKATTGGWVQVDLGHEVSFTVANASVGVGDTLTQGGVTATIKAIVIESGTQLATTAAGRLIITAPAGGNFAAGAATSTGGGALTLSGVQTAITLSAGGRYEFDNYAFSTTKKMYGCNGTDREFEFDGTTFVPLNHTGTTKASFIIGHSNHLIMATGTSLTVSAIGNPYNYEVANGASEISVGDTATSMLRQPGTSTTASLVIYTRNDSNILYGTSSADFQLVTYQQNVGAYPYTGQNIGTAYSLDERGIIKIGATQQYGNFAHAAISRIYTPWLNEHRPAAVASSVWRSSNQYRLFFSDGWALYVTMNGQETQGALPVLMPNPVACICNADDPTRGEVGFFGSTDGYVYEMEKGTSFDGADLGAYIRFPYYAAKSPRTLKTWKRGRFDIDFDGYAALSVQPSLSYGSSDPIQPSSGQVSSSAAVSLWDNGNWDNGNWDGRQTPIDFELTGTGETVSMSIYASSAFIEQFTVQGFLLHYINRRSMR